MKKRFITLLLAIVMVATLSVVFTGCSEEGPEKIVTSEKDVSVVGSYSLFRTTDVQEYLNFLENLDETKYEIVDISTSMEHNSQYAGSMEFYMVTYKKIAE